jgi:hypothetical protein
MENTTEQRKTELLGMNLDYDGGQTLLEAIRWSKFLSIVAIVGIGLLILVFGIFGPIYAIGNGVESPYGAGIVWLVLGLFMLYLGAWVMAAIILLRFSRQTKRGIQYQDQVLFNRGLKSLKTTFLILGIVSSLSLVATIITIIVNPT